MEMFELYHQMELKLQEIEPKYCEAEKAYEFHMAEAEKAAQQMDKVKSSVEALRKAIAALETGDFSDLSVTNIENKKEASATVSKDVPKVEPESKPVEEHAAPRKIRERAGKWKHLEVWQYKPNGEAIGNWTSQRAAARSLGWSSAGLNHFMKNSKEKQIRERGYYLEWVG